MSIIELTDSTFDNARVNKEKPVVVDFWATWCGPCRKLIPILETISEEYKDKAIFAKLNIEENMESAKKLSISGLPSIIIFKNGEAVERITGLVPKSTITTNLEKHL